MITVNDIRSRLMAVNNPNSYVLITRGLEPEDLDNAWKPAVSSTSTAKKANEHNFDFVNVNCISDRLLESDLNKSIYGVILAGISECRGMPNSVEGMINMLEKYDENLPIVFNNIFGDDSSLILRPTAIFVRNDESSEDYRVFIICIHNDSSYEEYKNHMNAVEQSVKKYIPQMTYGDLRDA